MTAEIKSWMSPDVDVEQYQPSDPSDVSVFMELQIGLYGERGADLFGITVVTPGYLQHQVHEQPVHARHMAIVSTWEWAAVRSFLAAEANRYGRVDDVLGEDLSRIAAWEFEDFRELGEPQRPTKAPVGSMTAAIKSWTSPDLDVDTWEPVLADHVGVQLELLISSEGTSDRGAFTVMIATPGWLKDHVAEHGPIIGWGVVVVPRWDWALVTEFLDGIVAQQWGSSWEDLAERLGRFLRPVLPTEPTRSGE